MTEPILNKQTRTDMPQCGHQVEWFQKSLLFDVWLTLLIQHIYILYN